MAKSVFERLDDLEKEVETLRSAVKEKEDSLQEQIWRLMKRIAELEKKHEEDDF